MTDDLDALLDARDGVWKLVRVMKPSKNEQPEVYALIVEAEHALVRAARIRMEAKLKPTQHFDLAV